MDSISQLNGVVFGKRTLGMAGMSDTAYHNKYSADGGVTFGYTDVVTADTNPGNVSGVIGSVAFVPGGTPGVLYDGGTVVSAVQFDPSNPYYTAPDSTHFGTFGKITLYETGRAPYPTQYTYYIHGFSQHALLISSSATLTKAEFNGVDSTDDPNYFEVLSTYDLSVGTHFSGFTTPITLPTNNHSSIPKSWKDAENVKHIFKFHRYDVAPGVFYTQYGGYGFNTPYIPFYTWQGDTPDHPSPNYPIHFTNQMSDFVVPCYAQGTRILTTRGEVAVEELAAGDEAVLTGGGTRPVIWIGSRKVRCAGRPGGQDVRPVRIRQGAFGDGLPHRDLVVSPGHAIFVDGQLVPAAHLLNGATIVQEVVESVRYFHVELDAHDVLLAEGLPSESYLDDGNRQTFANHEGPLALFERLDTQAWDEACAPLMTDPYALEAVRSRLVEQAEALGWRRVTQPALQVLADGEAVAPLHASGQRWWFLLPAAREFVLSSAADVLSDLRPELHDGRRLGVAVSELRLNGVRLDLAGASCQAGFYPLESRADLAWRWTDGRAHLAVEAAEPSILEVEVIMVAPTWARPAARLELVA
jgi:hypothetical protein